MKTKVFKSTNKQFIIHLFIWLFLLASFTLVLTSSGKRILPHLYTRIGLGIFFFYTNYSILVPTLLIRKRIMAYLLAAISLLTIAHYTMMYIFPVERSMAIHPPKIIPVVLVGISFIIGAVIRVYEQWLLNERTKKEIELQKDSAELKVLKNQLSPHFLFNALNSIYALTLKNSKESKSSEAIMLLSQLMRYMLYETENNYVSIQKEIEYIENYIALQKLQVANSEEIDFSIKGAVSNQKISPLLLISFIENAFKYGTDSTGKTKIKIGLELPQNGLIFKCENIIGHRTTDYSKYSGIGMQNTKERLRLIYPKKHWLKIEEEKNIYKVRLEIKLD